ncbi:MAG: Gfo/Idh/MocA family oxidoreductase, partial [Clostridia bacterium]|nr:Gfo/Idh/MocA family oxidoreductase [Clostridia bacterium]
MKSTVGFGIIGCGVIAHFHAQALADLPRARLVGAYGTNEEKTRAFTEKWRVRQYESLQAMLADKEIDAVCICTPSGLHTQQAVLAMRAGKHVVCEKPMSVNLTEADELIATARETGVKVCIISQYRLSPAVQEIKRALDAGALGKVVQASLSMKYFRTQAYYDSAAWRGTWAMDGGGALMNQGIHGVDVFRYLMGPVRSLYA